MQAAAYTNTPALALGLGLYTFEDLRATGNLGLVRVQNIKEAPCTYYRFDQGRRQWTQPALDGEQHHFELVAGVTDHEQERSLYDNFSYVSGKGTAELRKNPFEPEPIRAAVERLRLRQDVVDWLPNLRISQRDAVDEKRRRLAPAESLLLELTDYSARLEAGWTGQGSVDIAARR